MRKPVWLAGLAVWALAASPAFAQPQPRDHRKADRPNQRVPAVAGDKEKPARPRIPPPQVSDFQPKDGAPGTVVTIRGRRLGGVSAVVFGGREIKVDKVGPRAVTFTVPRIRKHGPTDIALKHPAGDLAVGSFDLKRMGRDGEKEPPPGPPPPPPGAQQPHPGVQPAHPGAPPHAGPPGAPPRPGADVRDHRRRKPREWRQVPTVAGYHPKHGTPGTEVTIRGRNFGPNMKVMYNGAEVPAAKTADRKITFVVPKGKGDGMIVLMGAGTRRGLVVGKFDNTRKWDPKENRRRDEELRKKAEEEWKARKATLAKNRADRMKWLREREEELAQTREERRHKRIQEIRARWQNAFLSSEQAQAEIALHAERMARLDRMRRLAEANDSGKLVVRIDIAIERENSRHDNRMETLKANFQNQ